MLRLIWAVIQKSAASLMRINLFIVSPTGDEKI